VNLNEQNGSLPIPPENRGPRRGREGGGGREGAAAAAAGQVRAGRKENVRKDRAGPRGARVDLEATQFPLTAGVLLESIYRSPPPPVVSCRGNRTRSFSLSRRMSHSLPVHTQARTCDGRARAHLCAHASAISQIL